MIVEKAMVATRATARGRPGNYSQALDFALAVIHNFHKNRVQ
ncbi:MAG: hypothetical protein ACR2H5_22715 [Ktedonobacteraceae bacterium]